MKRSVPTLRAHDGIAVWSLGRDAADIDVWLLHSFADSHLSFRDSFAHLTHERIRVSLFDLPGHGASPPRPQGLTVEEAALVSADLIGSLSSSRQVVLVAHSMASIIATRVAQTLGSSPTLFVSVEGNLTRADAYLSGQAADFDDPDRFYASFRSERRRSSTKRWTGTFAAFSSRIRGPSGPWDARFSNTPFRARNIRASTAPPSTIGIPSVPQPTRRRSSRATTSATERRPAWGTGP